MPVTKPFYTHNYPLLSYHLNNLTVVKYIIDNCQVTNISYRITLIIFSNLLNIAYKNL